MVRAVRSARAQPAWSYAAAPVTDVALTAAVRWLVISWFASPLGPPGPEKTAAATAASATATNSSVSRRPSRPIQGPVTLATPMLGRIGACNARLQVSHEPPDTRRPAPDGPSCLTQEHRPYGDCLV